MREPGPDSLTPWHGMQIVQPWRLGLCLFIVCEIVHAHGIDAAAQSTKGRTRFKVSTAPSPMTIPWIHSGA